MLCSRCYKSFFHIEGTRLFSYIMRMSRFFLFRMLSLYVVISWWHITIYLLWSDAVKSASSCEPTSGCKSWLSSTTCSELCDTSEYAPLRTLAHHVSCCILYMFSNMNNWVVDYINLLHQQICGDHHSNISNNMVRGHTIDASNNISQQRKRSPDRKKKRRRSVQMKKMWKWKRWQRIQRRSKQSPLVAEEQKKQVSVNIHFDV